MVLKMKQKIYIDFDSTLFDVNKYLQNLYKICEKYNIKKDELDEITNNIFKNHKAFFIDDLLKYLLEEKNVDKNIKRDFSLLEKKAFLFDDTLIFLKSIQTKYEPILLTCGNIYHQQKKINACNIKEYFSDVIIVQENKSKVDNVDYQNGIFIDNNPLELEKFISVNAKRVIRIKRNSDKYSKINLTNSKLETYNTLKDVLKVL